MPDMLSGFVKQELDNQIKTGYPHIKYPSCMYAAVTSSLETEPGTYVCTLKVLDRNKNMDERFPEIPMVRTSIFFAKGDTAVIILLYGDFTPYIIGRADG